jgi:hypothetical protein
VKDADAVIARGRRITGKADFDAAARSRARIPPDPATGPRRPT